MPDNPKFLLNPIQLKAVEHHINSPLKVIAGAGTGKTMVLTHRFVHILKEHPDIAPGNILALTFTNKAAAEMRERIIALARNEGVISENTSILPALWISNFHSFCGRVLRENAFESGLDPNFNILSEADARQIHHRIVEDFLNLRLNTDQFKPDEYNYVSFENPAFLYSDALILISILKDQLIGPDRFRELSIQGLIAYYKKLDNFLNEVIESEEIASRTRDALERRFLEHKPLEYGFEAEMIEILYHIYKAYQDYLDRNNMLDFGDLIFKAFYLLDDNERLRQRYQQQFKYILVDEFQDTNEAQFKLLRLLARDDQLSNVTIVGDDKQAIYGWRNARVENVDDFDTNAWGGLHLNVSLNYRSYGEILDVAHFAIIQEEKFRLQADLIKLEPAMLGMSNNPVVTMYEANSREQEAEFVAFEIIKLLKEGFELDDIIILMRGLGHIKTYEDTLRRFHIPYRTTGGTGFYDRQEIKDILAYLMVIEDPLNTKALMRVLKRPPVALNDLSLYHLRNHENYGDQLFDAINNAENILNDSDAIKRIKKLLKLLGEMWETMIMGGVFHIISQLLDRSGYLKYLHSLPEEDRERSLANLRKLVFIASEFDRKHPLGNLRDFIQYAEFSMYQTVMEPEAATESDRKSVQIMTVHQAKGLEFNVVFITNLIKQNFPTIARHPEFSFDETDGLIINQKIDGDRFFKFEPYDLKNNSHLYEKHGIINHYEKFRDEHLREERRILYVAITRAKQRLYLSRPKALKDGDMDFFQELLSGFADKGQICQFRSFTSEDISQEVELPLWLTGEKSAFGSVEEAREYGKRLFELSAESADRLV